MATTAAATAPYDSDGIAVPAGWIADKIYDPHCANCGETCKRVERTWLHLSPRTTEIITVGVDNFAALGLPGDAYDHATLATVEDAGGEGVGGIVEFDIFDVRPDPWTYNTDVWRDRVNDRYEFHQDWQGWQIVATCYDSDGAEIALEQYPYITDPSDLGGQNRDILGQAWYGWSRAREVLQWLFQGQPLAGSSYNGVNHINFSDSFEIQIASAEGNAITLNGSWSPAAKLPSHAGSIIHAQPGDMIRIGGAEAMVARVSPTDSNVLYLHKAIAIEAPAYGWLYREMDRPNYAYHAPYRGLWVHRHTTGWISRSAASIPVALRRADGSHGRIAWPVAADATWRGTLTVWAEDAVGAVSDITGFVMANFPGGGQWLWMDRVSGVDQTWIDLSSLDGYQAYKIDYCPEVADQSNPIATSLEAFRPTQNMCGNCLRDFSDSIKILHNNMDRGYATDEAGHRWFCAQAGAVNPGANPPATSTAIIPDEFAGKFSPWCNLTKCPGHTLHQPWQPSADQVGAMMLGRNIYSKEQMYGMTGPFAFKNGRSAQPSLHWLSDMPNPTRDNAGLAIMWYGSRSWGYLRAKATEEKDADEGAVSIIDHPATQQVSYPARADRAGGTAASQALADDGSDFFDVETVKPERRMASISNASETTQPGGACESAVQSVRRAPIILPGIAYGVDGVIDNTAYTWDLDAHTLTLRCYALGQTASGPIGRPFPSKSISENASRVNAIEIIDDVLWITFSPEVVETGYISGGEWEETKWICGGGTVAPAPWLEIVNGACAREATGMQEKLCRGDSIRFFSGLTGHATTFLTCLWAQAFNGAAFSGSLTDGGVTVDSAATPTVWSGVPEWYQTPSQRLKMDRAAFDLSGHKAEALATALAALGDLSGLRVEVSCSSAFPPVQDWAGMPTGYGVGVRKNGEAVSAGAIQYDPANGAIVISGVDAWAEDEAICLQVTDAAGTGHPYVVTRENTIPAEWILAIQAAHESLQWVDAGSFGTPKDILIREKFNWAQTSWGWLYLSPATVALRNFYVLEGTEVVAHKTWAQRYNNVEVVPATVLAFLHPDDAAGSNRWNDYFEYYATQAGNDLYGRSDPAGGGAWAYSGPAGYDDDNVWLMLTDNWTGRYKVGITFSPDGGWDNPMLWGAYQAHKLNLDYMGPARQAPAPIRRWKAAWIAEAKIDIKLSGATQVTTSGEYAYDWQAQGMDGTPSQTTETDITLTLGLLHGEQYDLNEIHNDLGGDAVRFSCLGVFSPGAIAAADQDKWVTVDITALARIAAEAQCGVIYKTTTVAVDATAEVDLPRDRYASVTFRDSDGVAYNYIADVADINDDAHNIYFDAVNDKYVLPDGAAGDEVVYTYTRDLYIAIVGAGQGADAQAFDAMTVQDLFRASCSNWDREYQAQGSGQYDAPAGTAQSGGGTAAIKIRDAQTSSVLEYDGVAFRGLKIKMDWAAMMADPDLPHIAYGPYGVAGHWPVDMVADLA